MTARYVVIQLGLSLIITARRLKKKDPLQLLTTTEFVMD